MSTRRYFWVGVALVALAGWWTLGTNLVHVGAQADGGATTLASSAVAAKSPATQPTVTSLSEGADATVPKTPAITVAGPGPALGVIEVLDECVVKTPEPLMVATEACQTQPACAPPREPIAICPPVICTPPPCAAPEPPRAPAPIPEPATLALAGVAGGAALVARRIRRRRGKA